MAFQAFEFESEDQHGDGYVPITPKFDTEFQLRMELSTYGRTVARELRAGRIKIREV